MNRTKTLCILVLAAALPAGARGEDGPLTWRRCVEIASMYNPDLLSSREQVSQDAAGVGAARSTLLPQVEADASVSTGKKMATSVPGSGDRTNSYSYGITGRQLLFDGLKSVYDLDSAGKKLSESEYGYLVTSANVRLSLRSAFVRLLRAQESIDLYSRIVKRRRQNLELVKMRYEAGREHKGSLMTAQASLARGEADAAQAARSLVLAQRGLAKEMGLETQSPLAVTGSFQAGEPEAAEPDFVLLVSANPVLQKMIRQKEIAELGVKSAGAGYYPQVYGFLSADRTGATWPPANTEWQAGVQATLPLFQGGASYYDVRGREAALRKAREDVRSTRGAVLYTLQQKWIAYRNALDDAGVQLKFLRAAEERAKIAESQYSIGLIQFDNWIIIEDNLVQVQKNYLDARAGAQVAEAEWIQAKGETLNYE